jgi:hypothetical protein
VKLLNASNQQVRHFLYDASGAITTGGTAQLVLARSMARSLLYLQNTSIGSLWFEFDGPRAHATLTNGVVTGVSIDNAGFNMTKPPVVRFLGGGYPQWQAGGINTSYLGLNQPNGPSPSHPATGHATLATGAVSSITVDDGGANYAIAPYVQLITDDLDPYGCAVPAQGSGWQLASGESLLFDKSAVPTEAVGVFGATTGQKFICKWMD